MLYFNSIKVQLEHIYSMANRSNINFNSIKVQLERFFPFCSVSSFLFQFHKGTIRTLCTLLDYGFIVKISIP